MFIRYKTDKKGRSIPVAKIYSQKEHPIKNSMIDKDALWAIRKLQQSGAEAYVVGGAIRDILLSRKPKDVDIATSASPRQVQRLFWNSRIIGRRFRIVHIFFNEKIIEVTTFRSDEENFEEGNNNVFGTIEQDSKRRDFSINSLYYNPSNGQLLDFNEAYPDFKKRVIRSLIPLSYSFSEDPVRMIRALKYQATTGFSLKWNVKHAIKKNAPHIADCSTSRLTDEITKILSSGCSYQIFTSLAHYKLLPFMLPAFSIYFSYNSVKESFIDLDKYVVERVENGEKVEKAMLLYYLIRSIIIIDSAEETPTDEVYRDAFRQAKVLIAPITPPNYELEKAVTLVLADFGLSLGKKKKANNTRVKQVRKSSREKNDKKRRDKKKYAMPLVNIEDEESAAKTLAEVHDR